MITGSDGSGVSSVAVKVESDQDDIDSGSGVTDVCSRDVSGCCGTAHRESDGTLAGEGSMRGSIVRISLSIG